MHAINYIVVKAVSPENAFIGIFEMEFMSSNLGRKLM